MKKRLTAYRAKIDALLIKNSGVDWENIREEHLIQISFFQHERLIHLIVTVLFTLVEVIFFTLSLLCFSTAVLVLCLAVLLLLIPYIFHFYALENGVQKLYEQYDRIKEKCEEVNNSPPEVFDIHL